MIFIYFRTLAGYFVMNHPYYFKDQFIVYPFDKNVKELRSTKKAQQRWEQCVENLINFFGPAVHGLYKKKFFNKEVQDSVHNLTKDVIKDLITFYNKTVISDDAKQDVAHRLNTAKIHIGYPEEIFDLQKIEEFYEDLELDETDGVINTFIKIKDYYYKIDKNPETDWKRKLYDKYRQFDIKYDTDESLICEFD